MTISLSSLLKRYLDNHCQNADAEGMSALCECKLCIDTRNALLENYEFAIDELRALYRILEHEFIPYDDFDAQATVRKIARCIQEHELAQANNGAA